MTTMENKEKTISIKDLKSIKDAILAKEQGEALKRITKPETQEEGLGLGFFESQTVLTLNAIDLFEDIINSITGLTDTPLHTFTRKIGVSSGSRQAKRMEKSLETIGQLGQYIPGIRGNIPEPTVLKAPEKG